MTTPKLIIVSGLPGAGKTTLAKRLAKEVNLPLIHRDGIKELLFDSLGWKDREWSKQMGVASYTLLWHFTETLLAAGCSCVIESNFSSKFDTPKLLVLRVRYGFESVQVICVVAGEVLLQRFKARVESGERHPGHVDHVNFAEAESTLLNGGPDVLEIGGRVIQVDTTNDERLNYAGLIEAIRSHMSHEIRKGSLESHSVIRFITILCLSLITATIKRHLIVSTGIRGGTK